MARIHIRGEEIEVIELHDGNYTNVKGNKIYTGEDAAVIRLILKYNTLPQSKSELPNTDI